LIALEFIPRSFKYPHCHVPSTLPKYNMLVFTLLVERDDDDDDDDQN